MANCVFPTAPIPPRLTPGYYDQRTFKVGEPVCLRNQIFGIESGTYVKADRTPGTGNVNYQIVRSVNSKGVPQDRTVYWWNVGKILQPVSPTAINATIRSLKLPENIATAMKGYGRKRKSRSKKSIRSRRRRHTRK